MTTPTKIQGHSFYGLRDLEEDDVQFPWRIQKKEHEGCLVYELHRQILARVIWRPKTHQKLETKKIAELRSGWMSEFQKPWPQLSRKIKLAWIAGYKQEISLRWSVLCEDPAPQHPGTVYSVKIDWDLTDSELTNRFKLALTTGWRGELKPNSLRTESPASYLSAMVAQRLYDCKRDDNQTAQEFAKEVYGREKRFTSSHRIHEGSKRFQKLEETFKIGRDAKGLFRLKIDPKAHRLKAD